LKFKDNIIHYFNIINIFFPYKWIKKVYKHIIMKNSYGLSQECINYFSGKKYYKHFLVIKTQKLQMFPVALSIEWMLRLVGSLKRPFPMFSVISLHTVHKQITNNPRNVLKKLIQHLKFKPNIIMDHQDYLISRWANRYKWWVPHIRLLCLVWLFKFNHQESCIWFWWK